MTVSLGCIAGGGCGGGRVGVGARPTLGVVALFSWRDRSAGLSCLSGFKMYVAVNSVVLDVCWRRE